jgi:predicted Rossmann-fold nucleotide-binding protein
MRELIVCGGGSEGIPGMVNQETGKHITRHIGLDPENGIK